MQTLHLKVQVLIGNREHWEKHPTYDKALRQENCGLDIPMPCSVIVPPRAKAYSVSLGISTEPSHAYMLVPRSSITKTPLRLANSIGIIDKSYRGQLIAKVDNLTDKSFTLEDGNCYFQIISFDGNLPSWSLDTINSTERGSGAFGSTTM